MTENNQTDFEKITDFKNLYAAYKESKCGKGFCKSSMKFQISALDGIYQIERRLETKTYQVSQYHQFTIYEPKERIIKACSFQDKIVQHSLCDNVLLPVLSNEFIQTNYAGQIGKGTLYGLDCLKTQMYLAYCKYGFNCWIIKADISKFQDEEFARWCSDHNTKWNDSNFFMSDNVGVLSNCCRLLSDTSKLDGFINSIGGTALSIGSVKVNTINLMRIAYEVDFNEKKYLNLLRKRTELCCKTLDVIRHIISRNVEKGLLPNYCDGGIEMDKQYCTCGILGLYEVIEAFGYTEHDEFGNVSYSDRGIEFASKIFEVLNDVKDNFTDEFSYNVESVPAERAAVILCQKDNLLYEKKDKFIYSNQWIPLSERCTIQEKLRLSSIFDTKCSGGAIAHINLEHNFPNTDMAWDMLNKIAESGVIYFAFNTRINECDNHHGFVGTDICPECGHGIMDTYQRIVGFLEPVRSYSKDRKREFNTRQWYSYADMKGEI